MQCEHWGRSGVSATAVMRPVKIRRNWLEGCVFPWQRRPIRRAAAAIATGDSCPGERGTPQPAVSPDVLALLQQQGEQIAALSGQVAELQKRLAQTDAQASQVRLPPDNCRRTPWALAASASIGLTILEMPESSAV